MMMVVSILIMISIMINIYRYWSGDNNKCEVAALSADTALVKEFFCSATNVATGRSAELTAYQEVRSAREGPHKLV